MWWYTIRVSKHGVHYFETSKESLENVDEFKAMLLLKEFEKRFSITDGFLSSLHFHELSETTIKIKR